jgi:hypothetical protein
MKLDGSYEFSELTQVDGVFVSNGKERASGKIIQIHLFPAAKAEQANRICQRLLTLPESAQKMILRYGQEGSASYFVTEPLPAGEYLQSWVERHASHGPAAHSAPEVSGGLTDQLRQLGIRPSPLSPMMPGPEQSAPAKPPAAEERPGELTREFRSLYGGGTGDGKSNDALLPPPANFPAEPAARPEAAKAPGLETWLNFDAAAVRERPEPAPPPAPAAPEPPPRKPPLLTREPAGAAPGDFTRSFRSLYGDAEPDTIFTASDPQGPTTPAPHASRVFFEPAAQAPTPVYAATPAPAFPPAPAPQWQPAKHVSPMSSSAVAPSPQPALLLAAGPARKHPSPALDWKMILLVAGALIILAGVIVAIMEMSGG